MMNSVPKPTKRHPPRNEATAVVDLSWETAALAELAQCGSYGHEGRLPLIGGMDEVGRGALAGPVCVGVAVLDQRSLDNPDFPQGFPVGLNDSKQLTARRRVALQDPIQAWVRDFAIGQASNTEIDELGIMPALRLAGWRALNELDARGHLPQRLLLDGNFDYLASPRQPDLFAGAGNLVSSPEVSVETLVKGDGKAAVIAAAAVLAKVYRDAFMRSLHDPGYGWARNVGYGTPAHKAGLAELGASVWHRKTWKLR